jgi:hypothetical protein
MAIRKWIKDKQWSLTINITQKTKDLTVYIQFHMSFLYLSYHLSCLFYQMS